MGSDAQPVGGRRTSRRLVYLVSDYGGEYEDAWENPVMAFTTEAAARECAAKRRERRLALDPWYTWEYRNSAVTAVRLVGADC
jgi:hypothetical protein